RQQLSDGRPLKSGGEGLLAGWGGQAAKARRGGIQTRSRRRRHSRQWTFQIVRWPLDSRKPQRLRRYVSESDLQYRFKISWPRFRLDAAWRLHRQLSVRRILVRRHFRNSGSVAGFDYFGVTFGFDGIFEVGIGDVRLRSATAE